MMLYLVPAATVSHQSGLGVAHATLHVALRDVPQLLSVERIMQTISSIRTVTQAMLPAAEPQHEPRIGVCALNPHAGEEGLFGDEESRVIQPAVRQAVDPRLELHRTLPADTLLSRATSGEFRWVVAMYHDQGHIALKLLTMHQAVNITLGIARNSYQCGTWHRL